MTTGRAAPGTLAILVWGLRSGAFANLATTMSAAIARATGRPVELVYLHADPGETVCIPAGVRIVRLGCRRAALSTVAVRRYLRERRPDVLIAMPSIVAIPALAAYCLAGRRVRNGIKFVIHQGDTLTSDVRIGHRFSPRMRILPTLARILYRKADGMTACSGGVLDLLREGRIRFPAGPVQVIPNPVDVDACREWAAGAKPTHPWLTERTGPVFTTLGQLVPRKNHELLFHALADVRLAGHEARLIVFGDGPRREACQAAVDNLGLTDAVSFAGFVVNPFADIAKSDAFVMSSLDEAFCLALVEAMACEVAVVSTDAVGGGPRSILSPSDQGIPDRDILSQSLVPHDAAALSNVLRRIVADDEYRVTLSGAARRRANDFSPTAVGEQWARFVGELERSVSLSLR